MDHHSCKTKTQLIIKDNKALQSIHDTFMCTTEPELLDKLGAIPSEKVKLNISILNFGIFL